MDIANRSSDSPSSDKNDKTKDGLSLLLVTTVDIGGGLSGKIELRKGDEPLDAAQAFCLKHNLPQTIVEPLTLHLLENLKKASKGPEAKTGPISDKDNENSPNALEFERSDPVKKTSESDHDKEPADAKQEFSFGNGMDDKLYQKLSSKLLHVDETRHNKDNVLSASDFMKESKRKDPKRSSNNTYSYRVSAEPRRDTVYNRLYVGALDRIQRLEEKRKLQEAEVTTSLRESKSSIGWISAEMMKGRGKGFDNYGEMLYAKGLETTSTKKVKADLYKTQLANKEMEGVTFKPDITKKAMDLKFRDSSSDESSDEMWRRLHSRGMRKSTIDRLENLRRQREMEEVSECTFRPRINKTSESLMSQRSETLKILNISHYDQLFQDAVRRQKKAEEMANWYPDDVTFQPAVNHDPRAEDYVRRSCDKLAKDANVRDSVSSTSSINPNVVERLYANMKKRDAKIEEARARAYGDVDLETGRPLYMPEINHTQKYSQRNREGKPIGEHLYQVAKEIAAKHKQQEMQEMINAAVEANKPRSTATSQSMFMKLKLKRFGQIFEYLDETGVGLIDLVSIVRSHGSRLENLDSEVLADVETAASVWAHANGTTLDVWPEDEENEDLSDLSRTPANGLSEDATTNATSPRHAAGASSAADDSISRASTPSGAPVSCPPLNLEQFVAVMEQALILRRGPRSYLVPSPNAKQQSDPTFQPAINKRSKELAARLRPNDGTLYEVLYKVAAVTREKLEAVRREKEDEELKHCTFHPRLNANSKSVEGRALRLSRAANSRYACAGPLGQMLAEAAAAGLYNNGSAGNEEGPKGTFRLTMTPERRGGAGLFDGVDLSGEDAAGTLEQLNDLLAIAALNQDRLARLSAGDARGSNTVTP